MNVRSLGKSGDPHGKRHEGDNPDGGAGAVLPNRMKRARGIGLWAAAVLAPAMTGSIGTGIAPPAYFGIAERFSAFAAVGFNAASGAYPFRDFRRM